MKRISGSTFVYLIISGLLCLSAFAETKITCKQGSMERTLEVVKGGEGGHACDVKYSKNGTANEQPMYYATTDANYCDTKAKEQSEKWATQGWTCDGAGAEAVAAPEAKTEATPENKAK